MAIDGADAEDPDRDERLRAEGQVEVAGRDDDDRARPCGALDGLRQLAQRGRLHGGGALRRRQVDDLRPGRHRGVDRARRLLDSAARLASRMRMATSFAAGATPSTRLQAAGRAAMMPATWVPCPFSSWAWESPSTRSVPARTLPASRGWPTSTPLSDGHDRSLPARDPVGVGDMDRIEVPPQCGRRVNVGARLAAEDARA